jgi:hypothetical protein
MLCFKLQARRVIPRVREIGKPIRRAQHEQHDTGAGQKLVAR